MDAPHAAPEAFPASAGDLATLPAQAVMTTRVLVATPDDDIPLAWELMLQAGVHHLPVVDGTRPIGMIDDRRLARACSVSLLAPRPVRDLIEHPPIKVHVDTSLRDIAARMAADRTDAVCVTTPAGDLIGIITTRDLVRVLAYGPPARRETDTTTVIPLLFRFTPVLPTAD
jgi:acetoin utilization protein AcuB